MKALYYGDTNIGNIRPKNEDAFVLKEIWGGTHLIAEQTSLQLWQRGCVNSTL